MVVHLPLTGETACSTTIRLDGSRVLLHHRPSFTTPPARLENPPPYGAPRPAPRLPGARKPRRERLRAHAAARWRGTQVSPARPSRLAQRGKRESNESRHSQVGCSGVTLTLVGEVGGGSGLGERDHLSARPASTSRTATGTGQSISSTAYGIWQARRALRSWHRARMVSPRSPGWTSRMAQRFCTSRMCITISSCWHSSTPTPTISRTSARSATPARVTTSLPGLANTTRGLRREPSESTSTTPGSGSSAQRS